MGDIEDTVFPKDLKRQSDFKLMTLNPSILGMIRRDFMLDSFCLFCILSLSSLSVNQKSRMFYLTFEIVLTYYEMTSAWTFK